MGHSPVQNAAAVSKSAGLAPGRQVRCGFCDRLLEVPFLPRAADGFLEAPSVSPAEMAELGVGRSGRLCRRRSWRPGRSSSSRDNTILPSSDRSIISSSHLGTTRPTGRLDQALIDLDTALEMARKAGPTYIARLDDWQKRRTDLALRDAQNVARRLARLTA